MCADVFIYACQIPLHVCMFMLLCVTVNLNGWLSVSHSPNLHLSVVETTTAQLICKLEVFSWIKLLEQKQKSRKIQLEVISALVLLPRLN